MDHLQERLDALEQRTHNVARQLCWWRRTAWLLVGLGLVCLPLQVAHTQGADEVTAQALTLEQRVAALEAKLTYLNTRIDSSGRPLMEIAGAKLRLVNGKGTTPAALHTTIRGPFNGMAPLPSRPRAIEAMGTLTHPPAI